MEKGKDHKCSAFAEKTVDVQTTSGKVTKSLAYECKECAQLFVPQDKASMIEKETKATTKSDEPVEQIDANKRKMSLNSLSGENLDEADSAEDSPGKLADSLIDKFASEDDGTIYSERDVTNDSAKVPSIQDEVKDDTVAETTPNVFSCKHCEKTILFASISTMFQHYRDVHHMECTPEELVAYSCYVCNSQFNTQKELDKHLLSKCDTIGTYSNSCRYCGKKCNQQEQLKQHLQFCKSRKIFRADEPAFDPISTFECSVCRRTFLSQSRLIEHHRNEHMGLKIYNCDVCHASFSWPENLERHMSIHQNDPAIAKTENEKIRCKVCSNPFHSIVSLSSHMSLSHPNHPYTLDGTWGFKDMKDVEPWVRPKLVKSSSQHTPTTLNIAVNQDEDLSSFVAELAGNTSKKRKAHEDLPATSSSKIAKEDKGKVNDDVLELDGLSVDNGGIVIIEEEEDAGVQQLVNAVAAQNDPQAVYCNICEKMYEDEGSGAMSLRCTHCGWNFKKSSQLQAHMEHLHAQDIIQSTCRVCQMQLKNNTEMDRHYSKEHPESRAFHCYQCESVFNTKSCLRGHLLRHQSTNAGKGSGDHVCPHCNMRYAHAHQLLTHITKSHQAFAPKPGTIGDLNTMFICGFCSKKFSYEGSLKIHLKQHEEKIKAQVLASGNPNIIHLK